MILNVFNRTCKVEGSDAERAWLDATCKARVKGYQYDPRFKRKLWDGFARFYSEQRQSVSAGLVEWITRRAALEGQIVELRDCRPPGPVPDVLRTLKGIDLRDYQIEAARALIDHTAPDNPGGPLWWPRGVLRIGTGGGKSEILALLAAWFPDAPVLVLVDRLELLDQTAARLQVRLGERVGVIGNGQVAPRRVTVAMAQTLDQNVEAQRVVEGTRVWLIDEVQHAGSRTYQRIGLRLKHAYVRVGVSATPSDRDNPAQIMGVMALTGDILYVQDGAQLAKAGILATPTIRFRIVDEPKQVEHEGKKFLASSLPWNAVYDEDGECVTPGAADVLIAENPYRNAEIARFVDEAPDKTTLILVQRIEHGIVLSTLLGCPFLSGKDSTTERKAVLGRIRDGTLRVLVASTILDEGVDMPSIRRVVLAGGGKCLGRGTPVLMYDGRVVPVEDVHQGDVVMGPDGPRRVLGTTRGRAKLYEVRPLRGMPWVCNEDHILTLWHCQYGVVDMSVKALLARGKTAQRGFCQFSSDADFAPRPEPSVDPYFFGVWLGDGRHTLHGQCVSVTTADPEVVAMLQNVAGVWGLTLKADTNGRSCPAYRLVVQKGGGRKNPLLDALRTEMGTGWRIPESYRCGSRAVRKALLAGLLDSDGYRHRSGYEITQKHALLAADIAFVARSLGCNVTSTLKTVKGAKYVRIHINGDCTELPLRIPRKMPKPRRIKKTAGHKQIKLHDLGDGEFFGFQLDGDGRFLLGDFTVTHNSEIRALQRIGRGMRKQEDSDVLDVLDFADMTNPITARHSRKRVDAYRRAGYRVELDAQAKIAMQRRPRQEKGPSTPPPEAMVEAE